jgi:hypothetical protein
MANTFNKISTVTVGAGGAASISFTSIPSTYTDLCIKISARTTNVYFRDSVSIRPNGATTNKNLLFLIGQGSTLSAGPASDIVVEIQGNDGVTANTFGNAEVYIADYASSHNKTFLIEAVTENSNASSNSLTLTAGLWSSSAAITSLTFISASFMEYSTATLYGIKNS